MADIAFIPFPVFFAARWYRKPGMGLPANELLLADTVKVIPIAAFCQDDRRRIAILNLQAVLHPRVNIETAVNMVMVVGKIKGLVGMGLTDNGHEITAPIFFENDLRTGTS